MRASNHPKMVLPASDKNRFTVSKLVRQVHGVTDGAGSAERRRRLSPREPGDLICQKCRPANYPPPWDCSRLRHGYPCRIIHNRKELSTWTANVQPRRAQYGKTNMNITLEPDLETLAGHLNAQQRLLLARKFFRWSKQLFVSYDMIAGAQRRRCAAGGRPISPPQWRSPGFPSHPPRPASPGSRLPAWTGNRPPRF